METTHSYIDRYGRPQAFYSDKHGVFRVNRREALSGDGLTQFSRAMKELDIKMIYANSPQAKGRVERSNRVLQDRLVKELRLQNISTIEEANAYLPTFMEEYNRRFAVSPQHSRNAHREVLNTQKLDHIFTIKESRQLSKNLMLQYKNVIYQVISDKQSTALRGMKVIVSESKNGEVRIFHKDNELYYLIYHLQEKQGEVIEAKRLESEWQTLIKSEKKKIIPKSSHPWRQRRARVLTV